MIKAIIFDLDNCVFDTSSMGMGVINSVIEPLNNSEVLEEIKTSVKTALKVETLDDVLMRFDVPEDIQEAMRQAYRDLDLPATLPAKTYGDELAIAQLPVLKFLVTSGYIKFQHSKIKRLGLAYLFDEIIVDEQDNRDHRKGKRQIFEEILNNHGLQKEEVLVVGDNPRSELKAAKELGIVAVQTLRPGVQKWEDADHHITSLYELSALLI